MDPFTHKRSERAGDGHTGAQSLQYAISSAGSSSRALFLRMVARWEVASAMDAELAFGPAFLIAAGLFLLSHGAAEIKVDLDGILNPSTKGSRTSQMYAKQSRRGRCLRASRGLEDGERVESQGTSPMAGTRGVRRATMAIAFARLMAALYCP